jgi:hypothetical protein
MTSTRRECGGASRGCGGSAGEHVVCELGERVKAAAQRAAFKAMLFFQAKCLVGRRSRLRSDWL